jgi:hypothetical protein
MRIEQGFKIRFKVFGTQDVLEAVHEPGASFLDVFKVLGLYPDDYIVTFQGSPLPIDSVPEHDDYVIYKVPSGG